MRCRFLGSDGAAYRSQAKPKARHWHARSLQAARFCDVCCFTSLAIRASPQASASGERTARAKARRHFAVSLGDPVVAGDGAAATCGMTVWASPLARLLARVGIISIARRAAGDETRKDSPGFFVPLWAAAAPASPWEMPPSFRLKPARMERAMPPIPQTAAAANWPSLFERTRLTAEIFGENADAPPASAVPGQAG